MFPHPAIKGGEALFGELLNLSVGSDAVICSLHTFRMTNEVDERGYYVMDRHAVVQVRMVELHDVRLGQITSPNVLLSLRLERQADAFIAEFFDVYGETGTVHCRNMEITFQPGKPE